MAFTIQHGVSARRSTHVVVNGNNYTFSPRKNCQETQLTTTGFHNGKPIYDKSTLEVVKKTNNPKKVKNQILAAYMDNRNRIKPLKL